MGREIRRVPENWQHPKDAFGNYIPLLEGYSEAKKEFEKIQKEKGLQKALDWFGVAPDKNDYMPEWTEEEKTHLQMYQNTSEGTPISPPMESPEKLARWLVDNNASAFGYETATYDQWLATIMRGFAFSMVATPTEVKNGVEAMLDD